MGKKQGAITALKTQLGNISIANGYNTDIGTSVYEWRTVSFSTTELPAIEIRDSDYSAEDMNNVLSNKELSIEIIAYDSPEEDAATLGRKYQEDILQAISTDIYLGNNVYQIEESGGSIEISQDSDITLSATINIVAQYQTNKWSD